MKNIYKTQPPPAQFRPALVLIAAILLILPVAGRAMPPRESPGETTVPHLQGIPFIRNQGQIADQSVLYHARTFTGNAFIKNDGSIVYAIPAPQNTAAGVGRAVAVIAESLVDAAHVVPVGAEPSATRVNFMRGAPAAWRTDTPCFQTVTMPRVYPGIDLAVRAHHSNIEKIFTIAPGANPQRIHVQLAGVTRLVVNGQGELEATTELGIVRFTKPVAWQDALAQDTDAERQPVAIAYAVDGHTFRFDLGAYDPSRPLLIDPLLAGTFVGGSGADVMTAITLDTASNVYAAGYTDSALDFPVTPGVITNYQGGTYDAVVAKFSPQMTELLAATFLGGTGEDQAWAAAFNPDNGMIYIGGMTDSTDFTGGGTNFGGQDGFVVSLDTNLQNPLAILLGGTSDDVVRALAIDNTAPKKQIYAAGHTGSADLNLVGAGAIQLALQGQTNAFIAVLHQTFNQAFCSATYLGGSVIDIADALTVDHANNIIIAGRTASPNFPIVNTFGVASAQTTWGGGLDAFIAKIGNGVSAYQASTYLGGAGVDAATAVAVDISNNVYVAGYTFSANFPTPNIFGTSYRTTRGGGSDIFTTRLSPELTNFQASTYLGGTGNDAALALAVISDTNSTTVYLAGSTYSTDFPVTPNVYSRTLNGGTDACMARFDDALTNLLNATYLGGTNDDGALAMCTASDSNSIYVVGSTASANFPIPGAGAQPEYLGGTADGFIVRMATSMQYGGLKWKVDLFDIDGMVGSPTMGWDGTIYVGRGTNLYAFNPDGSARWPTPFSTMHDDEIVPQSSGYPGYGAGAMATISSNGTIYIASSTNNSVYLYALDPEGGPLWSSPFEATGTRMLSSPSLGLDGTIFFGSFNGSFVRAVNPDGTQKWALSLTGSMLASSPVIGTNGMVYAVAHSATDGNTLYAIDPSGNGTVEWTNNLPGRTEDGYSSPLITADGNILVCAGSNLYAVGTTGALWGTWSTTNIIYSSPAIDSNGTVYVGSGDKLYAFNSANPGEIVRTWSVEEGSITSSPSIGADGTIYVGASWYLYSFAADGQTNWRYEIEDDINFHSPLIGTDGTIYMTDKEKLCALYGPEPPDQASAWSMRSHDVLRTGNAGFDPRRYAAPIGVTASKGTYLDRITVTWEALPNVIHYEVWRSTTNDPATSTRLRQTLQTNLTDTAIVPGGIYYYWLRAKTHVVVLSDFSTGDHGCTPPLPPTGVTASKGWPDYTNYVAVTWQESAHATLYNLYRAYDNDTNAATHIAALAVTNYDDFSVTSFPGRSHYYWVSAANTDGSTNYFSAWSAGDGVTNAGGIPPGRPRNLSAGKGLTSTNVPLAWDATPYATAYVIYRHTESNDPALAQAIFTNGMATVYNDGSTSPFKPYYYWLRATNQYGYSIYSDLDYGFTVLRPPLSVTASINQTNRVNMSWEIESTNAHSYLIYRGVCTNPAAATFLAEIAFNSASDTNFIDFGISLGSEYCYFVRARNAYGTSAHSPPSNLGGTYPLPPTGVEAADGTDFSLIQVTWNASPSAGTRGYQIYRATTADPNYAGYLGRTSSMRVFDDTGCEPGQRYYYWVTATNYLGASAYSGLNSGWRPLAAPTLVSAGNGDSTSLISVTWSAARNANRYEVWRNTRQTSHTAEKLENDWAGTAYNDNGVPAGEVYYYWVKAKNNQFVSEFSRSAAGFRALGAVDIAAQALVFKPNVLAPGAQPEAASLQIANRGPHNMTAPNSWITADFYLSATPMLVEEAAYWMGALTLNMPMAADTSRKHILTQTDLRNLNVPVLPEGAYYVFVLARHTLPSMWHDPNMANNHVRRTGNALRVNLTGSAQQLWNDYDGDGKSDPVVYRAADGLWRGWFSGNNYQEVLAPGFGAPGFVPVPGDYDGDGRTDPAVYRAADGLWCGWLSGNGYRELSAAGFGAPGCVPVPGDYDGDGRTDPAVYRAADGLWRGWLSGNNYQEVAAPGFGAPDAYPAPGGYDYDAKTDPAVYALAGGNWRLWLSTHGYAEYGVAAWGGNGLLPVPGDYNGDGLTDLAVYHTSTGYWFIRTLAGEQILWGMHWGGENYLPVPGDYDGDGVMDLAVYHQPTGRWFVQTITGSVIANGVLLGAPDFVPAAGILYP